MTMTRDSLLEKKDTKEKNKHFIRINDDGT